MREVRVIGPEGEQLGILANTRMRLRRHKKMDYDLVEVAPTSVPPVCRIMDYGKYKYELSKKEHQSRRHQKSTQVKEIKLRPRTDKHDLEIKMRQIKGFLADGNKTKVTVNFRGREMANQEMGRAVMTSVMEQVVDTGNIEYATAHGGPESDHDRRPQELIVRKRSGMPKMKTHSGASKRFKRTGSGKLVRRKAGKRHILTSKARDQKAKAKGVRSSGCRRHLCRQSAIAIRRVTSIATSVSIDSTE